MCVDAAGAFGFGDGNFLGHRCGFAAFPAVLHKRRFVSEIKFALALKKRPTLEIAERLWRLSGFDYGRGRITGRLD